jgi:poly-gamma-glutamate capsule biosynthesis protein CapA/YwtB (metallophosphatase superfamily)
VGCTIGLLGDTYLAHSRSGDALAALGIRPGELWFANLEAPFSSAGDEHRQHRAWPSGGGFKMEPALAKELGALTAVSIANNHALDFGTDAYLECIDVLEREGIGHAGGGVDLTSARAPYIVERGGVTVAFLAYTCLYQDGWAATDGSPGMSTIRVHTSYEAPLRVFEQPGWPPTVRTNVDETDQALIRREVSDAKVRADIVVVSVHWGLSTGERAVLEYQEALGRLVIDAGADVVFGHHPHALQPLIVHNAKPIFLSLGNIVFDYDKAWRGSNVTAAVRLHFESNVLDHIAVTPLRRDENSNPVSCDATSADLVAQRLFANSSGYSYELGENFVVRIKD